MNHKCKRCYRWYKRVTYKDTIYGSHCIVCPYNEDNYRQIDDWVVNNWKDDVVRGLEDFDPGGVNDQESE